MRRIALPLVALLALSLAGLPARAARSPHVWRLPGYTVTVVPFPRQVPYDAAGNWAVDGRWILTVSTARPFMVRAIPMFGHGEQAIGRVACSAQPFFDSMVQGAAPLLFCRDMHPTVTTVLGHGLHFRLRTLAIRAVPPPHLAGAFALSGFEAGEDLVWFCISGTDGPGGIESSGILNLSSGVQSPIPHSVTLLGQAMVFLDPDGRVYLVHGDEAYLWDAASGRTQDLGSLPDQRIEAVGPHGEFWASVPNPPNRMDERYVEELPGRGVVTSLRVEGFVLAYGPGWVATQDLRPAPNQGFGGTLTLHLPLARRTLRFRGLTAQAMVSGETGPVVLPLGDQAELMLVEPHP